MFLFNRMASDRCRCGARFCAAGIAAHVRRRLIGAAPIACAFAETRWPPLPNASIGLDIRISTEDEINVTVSWVG
jgi:hypothetical protein